MSHKSEVNQIYELQLIFTNVTLSSDYTTSLGAHKFPSQTNIFL